MARVIFGLVSLVCVLQTLAVPLRFRDLAAEAADPNSDILPPIASLNLTAINDAVQSIGAINTGNDADFANSVQQAQQDITSVINGSAADIAQGLNNALSDLAFANAPSDSTTNDQIAAAAAAIHTAIDFTSLAEPEAIF
ncbi:hypothetical protein B0H13DRAFT_2344686 [Mycena leptocephala]|nr:hypothetical protein B0H13DRAFT_2344686 [Mycena leptocephala]